MVLGYLKSENEVVNDINKVSMNMSCGTELQSLRIIQGTVGQCQPLGY